jgi:hypothetical protein
MDLNAQLNAAGSSFFIIGDIVFSKWRPSSVMMTPAAAAAAAAQGMYVCRMSRQTVCKPTQQPIEDRLFKEAHTHRHRQRTRCHMA